MSQRYNNTEQDLSSKIRIIKQLRLEIYFNNMVINSKIILIVVIIFATTISSTCKKKFICADSNTYTFINNYAKAYPDKDSIQIGDTLWIQINMPTILKDITTNTMTDFSNAVSVGNTFGVGLFTGGSESDPGVTGAVNKFDYLVAKGQLIDNSILNERIQFQFSKANDSFFLKVGAIPKMTGIYYLAISDDAGVHRKGDPCTKAAFEFQFANTDQHFYFLQNNRPGYTISDYERQHIYCFKVY